jgi:hemin uptake protein HemP
MNLQIAPMSNQPPQSPPASYHTPREIPSAELLRGEKEIWIRHGEEIYRLRLTRSGKLILQK